MSKSNINRAKRIKKPRYFLVHYGYQSNLGTGEGSLSFGVNGFFEAQAVCNYAALDLEKDGHKNISVTMLSWSEFKSAKDFKEFNR